MIQPLIFNVAGNIRLTKFDACGRLRNDEKGYYRHGDLFSVQPASNDTRQTIESGNSLYPVATRTTAKNDTLTMVFNTLDPEMESFVYDRTLVKQADTMKKIGYEVTIPDKAPFTVTLPYEISDLDNVFVVDVANDDFTKAVEPATPVAKEFTAATDTLTFAEADAGKTVYVTFEYAVTDAIIEDVMPNDKSAIMQLEHSTEAVTEMNGQLYDIYMVYDRVEVTEYATPLIGKTPGTRQVAFNVLKPRGTNPVVRKKYVPRGELCE